jgi:hypothetical protein
VLPLSINPTSSEGVFLRTARPRAPAPAMSARSDVEPTAVDPGGRARSGMARSERRRRRRRRSRARWSGVWRDHTESVRSRCEPPRRAREDARGSNPINLTFARRRLVLPFAHLHPRPSSSCILHILVHPRSSPGQSGVGHHTLLVSGYIERRAVCY